MIIFITMIYALFLFLRSVDMAMDYTSEMLLQNDNNILKEIAVCSLITFYFLENIPPIVLILILCMKLKLKSRSNDINTSSKESSVLEKMNTCDSNDTYVK
jgi:hypothetical protein